MCHSNHLSGSRRMAHDCLLVVAVLLVPALFASTLYFAHSLFWFVLRQCSPDSILLCAAGAALYRNRTVYFIAHLKIRFVSRKKNKTGKHHKLIGAVL